MKRAYDYRWNDVESLQDGLPEFSTGNLMEKLEVRKREELKYKRLKRRSAAAGGWQYSPARRREFFSMIPDAKEFALRQGMILKIHTEKGWGRMVLTGTELCMATREDRPVRFLSYMMRQAVILKAEKGTFSLEIFSVFRQKKRRFLGVVIRKNL